MTEYTRDIKPVDYRPANIPAPTGGSGGADALNAISAGIGIFGDIQNKKRQSNQDKMVGDLASYEAELSQNDVPRKDRLRKVDERIRGFGLDASSAGQLRTAFAQRRGSFVQGDMVADADNAELRKNQQLDAEFDSVYQNAPQLFSGYNRNSDGGYSREDKISLVSDFEDYRIRGYQRAKNFEVSQQLIAQGGEEAMRGAVMASNSISGDIKEIYLPTSAGLVSGFGNLDLQTDEGVAEAESILSNARNTFRVAGSTMEARYNSLIEGTSDTAVRKTLQENRDAALAQMQKIGDTLSDPDLSKMAERVQNIKLIQSGMQIQGLDNYGLVAALELVSPETSRFVVQRLVSTYPDIINQATKEMAQSILAEVDPARAVTKFGEDFGNYMKTGDTTKANDLVLKTFYDYARDTITNMPVRDLSAGEVDKIGGGLLGIMQEAAITDDPKQIREATRLLNSPNFQTFFEQLPDDRKAPMGRFINAFNQDVLIDSTDGYFGKLTVHNKNTSNIIYDVNLGKFVSKGVKNERLPSGSLGINITKQGVVNKDIDVANKALEMIRKNAQYDPITQNSKELIDTMIAEKLPQGIAIQGKLDVFTAKEAAAVGSVSDGVTQDKIRSNNDILENLRKQIDKLGEDVTLKSLKPEDLQKLLDASQVNIS
tara:strand:+ start:4591 stop:6558 length:1968 start_codon:yes stop_codon:yes gene_type:complete